MHGKDSREGGAARLAAGVLLGGLLALGVELVVLLLGAVAISQGVLRQDVSLQVTAAACVVGGLAGGGLACAWWPARKLLAGLAAGGMCFVLILAVALLIHESPAFGMQGAVELLACLCGGAAAGLLSQRRRKGRRTAPGHFSVPRRRGLDKKR